MRRVNDDSSGICPHELAELIEIKCPVVFLTRPPGADITPGSAGNLRQGLISGRMDNHMIALLKRGKHKQEDRFFRARVDENIVWLDRLIEFADLRTQCGASRRFSVAQPNLLKFLRGIRLKGKQV